MLDRFKRIVSPALLMMIAIVGCDKLDPESGHEMRSTSVAATRHGQTHRSIVHSHTATDARADDQGHFVQAASEEEILLESGDLLFIRGDTWLSRLVASYTGDEGYTHVGMIDLDNNGRPWFIHAYPSADALLGSDSPGVHRLPLDTYLTGESVVEAVVYRLEGQFHDKASVAVVTARRHVEEQTPFDLRIDLESTVSVYCSELVWRAYMAAGIDLMDGHFDHLHSPLIKGPVIFPSSLAANPMLIRQGILKSTSQEHSS